MVYFILGILILLFYLFMTPKSIRGTLDSVVLLSLIHIQMCIRDSPYPTIVHEFQKVISEESKRQILEKEGRLPEDVYKRQVRVKEWLLPIRT